MNTHIGYAKKIIKLGVYPIGIELIVGVDLNASNDYFKKTYYTNGDMMEPVKESTGICRREGARVAMLIPCNANTEVIVHECTHAISFALDFIGVNYGDAQNNEVLAYPLGYLCRQVFNFIHDFRPIKQDTKNKK